MNNFISSAKTFLSNIPGIRLKEKLVIFDSDDWGSTRVPGRVAKSNLIEEGIISDDSIYNKYDCLENETDLCSLYEVLSKYKDRQGRHPVFELNMVMGNPDFDQIAESDFTEYYRDDLSGSYRRYGHKDLIPLLKQGMDAGLVRCQFHAKEHLNVSLWLQSLRSGSEHSLAGLRHGFYGYMGLTPSPHHGHYLAAYHHTDAADMEEKKHILAEGLEEFERVFGFRSLSFTACNYIWHREMEAVAAKYGVQIIKSQRVQLEPDRHTGRLKRRYLYTGKRTAAGQCYLVRNAIFEPAENPRKDWVSSCMKEIRLAFLLGKPAVICSHRVNYIGSMDEENRRTSLAMLDNLIARILQVWPDVLFTTSGSLFHILNNKNPDQKP